MDARAEVHFRPPVEHVGVCETSLQDVSQNADGMVKKQWLAIPAVLFYAQLQPSFGQSHVGLSGLFYMDYEWVAASPDSAEDGMHGFRYRRLYLTADYAISEQFSGRVRLEAQTSRITSGRPFAFVKDLWLKWTDALGDGHDIIFGVQSPPSFVVSEKEWGYRSLARTIMDRSDIVSSRDFGVQLKGEFSKDGPVGYAVMLANNSGVAGETDPSKRVYGQLSWESDDRIAATLGADYAADPDGNAFSTNGFFSYETQPVRVGLESYYRVTDIRDSGTNDTETGVTLWTVVAVRENIELIGRVDRVERDFLDLDMSDTFVLLGVGFIPHRNVRFIPNLLISDSSTESAVVIGRCTIHADF